MRDTSNEEHAEAEVIGRKHDVPTDAVETLLRAIRRSGGHQAQFSHPALGGMGQWSRGGGIMIGDMFNHSLKAKVDRLCNELAEHVDDAGLMPIETIDSDRDWWLDFGRPSAVGSQNNEGYACFPQARRLAIKNGKGIKLYDTGDHRISGVSQQQGGSYDLSFASQHGTVRLSDLRPVENDHSHGQQSASETTEQEPPIGRNPPRAMARVDDVVGLIEQLHELQHKGVLTAEEFSAKKAELLARL